MTRRRSAGARIHISLCAILLATAVITTSKPQNGIPIQREPAFSNERMVKAYDQLPIPFEPNHGQFNPAYQFSSQGPGYGFFLKPTTAEIRFQTAGTSKPAVLRMKLRGANAHAHMRGDDKLPGEVNYFWGSVEEWITHVPTYKRVWIDNVYPGIDLSYYGNHNHFEYDLVVKPSV